MSTFHENYAKVINKYFIKAKKEKKIASKKHFFAFSLSGAKNSLTLHPILNYIKKRKNKNQRFYGRQ